MCSGISVETGIGHLERDVTDMQERADLDRTLLHDIATALSKLQENEHSIDQI